MTGEVLHCCSTLSGGGGTVHILGGVVRGRGISLGRVDDGNGNALGGVVMGPSLSLSVPSPSRETYGRIFGGWKLVPESDMENFCMGLLLAARVGVGVALGSPPSLPSVGLIGEEEGVGGASSVSLSMQ